MSAAPPKIKNRIWIARLKRGFTRKRLSRLLGHQSKNSLKEWENGGRTPSLEHAFLLAHFLGMPVEALFKDLNREVVKIAQARLSTERNDTEVINTP